MRIVLNVSFIELVILEHIRTSFIDYELILNSNPILILLKTI